MLALLYEIISQLGNLLALVNVLRGQGAKQAVENVPYEIDTATQELLAIQQDASISNAAIRAAIDTNASLATAQYLDVLAQIALVQQATNPVILPTIPPDGYASPGTAADIAQAVWSDNRWFGGAAASLELQYAGEFVNNVRNYSRLPIQFGPYFDLAASWGDPDIGGSGFDPPDPESANIVATDTLLTWLVREAPAFTWTADSQGTDVVSAPTLYGSGFWLCRFTSTTFLAFKAALFASGTITAPVWPGLDKVTLGTPVALAVALTIAQPMDGVIIELSSVPSPRGYYSYDGLKAYQQIGALTFLSDNGDAEYIQSLGFTEQVYAPKLMAHAAAVKIRTSPGVTGTVTPWVAD